MSVAALQDFATVRVLVRRDLMRFLRQPSRIIGALGQPVIFWFVIGSGMAATFRLPGGGRVPYLEYFFPGVVMMVLLFASIFATVSVIEDRQAGFLQTVLVAPGSRASLVLGKSLGAAVVALLQAAVLVALAPLAGFPFRTVNWPLLLVALSTIAFGLTAFGFALAWLLDNVQAYHAIQMTLLVPLWVLSGAMFPVSGQHAALGAIMRANPMTYATAVIRAALYGGPSPVAMPGVATALAVVGGFALVSFGLAAFACARKRS
jgi:daunorubicin resistance ABC transporter membrane protein